MLSSILSLSLSLSLCPRPYVSLAFMLLLKSCLSRIFRCQYRCKYCKEDVIVSLDSVQIKAKPTLITKDASKAVPGADLIIFCVPAFAHEQYFNAILPHVQPDTAIIGLPGQPGFEFQCFNVLKDKARRCAILSYESLPWACRILEFGRLVGSACVGLQVKIGLVSVPDGIQVPGKARKPQCSS